MPHTIWVMTSPALKPAAPATDRFESSDFSWLSPDGGGDKLASSQVAPIVALARNNATVSKANFRDMTALFSLPALNTNQGKLLDASLDSGDVLVMPWWSLSGLQKGVDTPAVVQYRPSVPALDDEGRERKYEFVSRHEKGGVGNDNILGVHPSTPASWLTDPGRELLIAEGQLKADAALTGALLDAGVAFDDLLVEEGEDCESARIRLSAIMAGTKIPCIVEIGGCWNWRGARADFGHLKLKRRIVLIGMDGDVGSNLSVWRATNGLWDFLATRGAEVQLLAPVAKRGGEMVALGIDDYLAADGNWADLMMLKAAGLPPEPAPVTLYKIGDKRCSDDMTQILEFQEMKSGGVVAGKAWVASGLNLAGRIVCLSTTRRPTREEVASGRHNPMLDSAEGLEIEAEVELEIGWRDDADQIQRATITGPTTLLSNPPHAWDRLGVKVPMKLLQHPSWPPAEKDGRTFLECVKAFRTQDVVSKACWGRDGWLPVPETSVPAFVVGGHVLCDPDQESRLHSRVTAATLPGFEDFGMGSQDRRKFADPDYQHDLARDLRTMIDGYLRAGVWSKPGVAPLLVAAALRPVIPIPTRITMYLAGRPGGGKSWSAAALMSFWAARPGSWMANRLPGSASDSIAAAEYNRSQAVIWVSDDLSPSASARRASAEAEAIETLIRAQFNSKGRARMNMNGTPRPPRDPHGMYVVTAEHKVPTKSILQRILLLSFNRGALGPQPDIDHLTELYTLDTVAARCTQGLVRYVREHKARQEGGWPGFVEACEQRIEHATQRAMLRWETEGTDQGLKMRSATMLGDLFVVLDLLAELCEELGLEDDYIDVFGTQTKLACAEAVQDAYREQEDNATSRSLLSAISDVLSSGAAHITNAVDPSAPPHKDPSISAALGWRSRGAGELSPGGNSIGLLLTDPKTDVEYVLLNPKNAFSIAQRQFASELGGAGLTQAAAWQLFYDDDLAYSGVPRQVVGGRIRCASQVRIGAGQRASGVPVALDDLLQGSPAEFGDREMAA